MHAPKIVAIIPARGGSKGVPGKNLRRVAGRTLVERAIDAAIAAERVDEVWVSTDAPAIAAVARNAGAQVVERPLELSGDTASSESALLHALDVIGAAGGEPDVLVFLQCTSPFTTAEEIDGAVGVLLEQPADSVFSACRSHAFLWRPGEEGSATGINHDPATRPRRQDRPVEYRETGAIYVMRVAGFRAAQHRFFGKVTPFEVPARTALDIDDEADLALAQAMAPFVEGCIAPLPDPPSALVMDFDGVMTDNRVYVQQDGTESVACDRGDGMGISLLRSSGLPMLVLSTETNPVVAARAAKLGLPVLHGREDKASDLRAWCAENDIDLARVIYVGNDINDVACLEAVGCGVAVSDAHPSALVVACHVLQRPGGHGAIRELCDLILQQLESRK